MTNQPFTGKLGEILLFAGALSIALGILTVLRRVRSVEDVWGEAEGYDDVLGI